MNDDVFRLHDQVSTGQWILLL